jgi:apolipoprotein N-acyltransferase
VKIAPQAVAFLGGAAAVLGFSPFDFFPAALAALVVLVHLWVRAPSPKDALRLGFFFGLGLYGVGASWVYVSLHRFGAMPMPLAATATLAWCAFLALFPALAGWIQARIARDSAAPAVEQAVLLIPAAWMLMEWPLSWFLTGFPWLAFGYTAIDDPLSGFAPLGGVYAVSLAMTVAAGLPASFSTTVWAAPEGESRLEWWRSDNEGVTWSRVRTTLVPINAATRLIVAELQRTGRVRRAFVGITGLQRIIYTTVSHLSGRHNPVFDSLDEAKDWLIAQA